MQVQIDLGTAAIAVVGLVAWFVRLEVKASRVDAHESELRAMRATIETNKSEVLQILSEIKASVARIEGQMVRHE